VQKEGLHFDAIYTGYLANGEQAEQIIRIVEMLGDEDTCLLVDPAMADNGKLYTCLPDSFPAEMRKLCQRAKIVTPNLTEALLLLGRDASVLPTDKDEIIALVRALRKDTGASVVLTSATTAEGMTGCAVLDKESDEVLFTEQPYVGHGFHGTGDVFSSVLLCAYLSGYGLFEATRIAADFVSRAISRTVDNHPALWYGVNFEAELADLAARLAK
jgi:pyridoxine kinase